MEKQPYETKGNVPQIKKEKTPPEKKSEVEASNLPDIELKKNSYKDAKGT